MRELEHAAGWAEDAVDADLELIVRSLLDSSTRVRPSTSTSVSRTFSPTLVDRSGDPCSVLTVLVSVLSVLADPAVWNRAPYGPWNLTEYPDFKFNNEKDDTCVFPTFWDTSGRM